VKPWLDVDGVTVFHGDCVEVMRSLPADSVDAVVTDPPYGLEFFGQKWDAPWKGDVRQKGDSNYAAADDAAPFGRVRHGGSAAYGTDAAVVGRAFEQWCNAWATEALRVLKPGGHLLAFGGTRTWHRLAVAIEDAGFEVRDSVAWMYASGFPKSLDVSKAIDKRAGAEREVVGTYKGASNIGIGSTNSYITTDRGVATDVSITAPATPAAEQWQGWGTALKPAHEPIVVARKPLIGTVAENVLTHGTGALNIDGCRIAVDANEPNIRGNESRGGSVTSIGAGTAYNGGSIGRAATLQHPQGRWPANVILDESQAAELDKQSGVSSAKPERVGRKGGCNDNGTLTGYGSADDVGRWPGDLGGGASRFFYVAKASKKERPNVNGSAHPTVKPMTLMRYLVRLVTPPGGTVLEPFAGSGTTIEACVIEGFNCIAIEREADYLPLIQARLNRPIQAAL
jgi:DNA modification methylase